MNARLLILSALCAAALSSCHHKELIWDLDGRADLEVVFDWRYAPDADPASMGLDMLSTADGRFLPYSFHGRKGGHAEVPHGTDYTAVCFNNDITDWAYFSHREEPEQFEISTADATLLAAGHLPARAVQRAAGAPDERMAATPGILWTDRVDGIHLPEYWEGTRTITLYPEERVCHYTVDVYDVENIDDLHSASVDATLSGMAEAYAPGRETATSTPVTMPFVLQPDYSLGSLHAEFLTFGDTPGLNSQHMLSMYLTGADGLVWHTAVDVSDQVDTAPDPRHVHIVVRGIRLPDPGTPAGGLTVDVDDWQAVYIDLHM